jgi:hypothetical protein
MSTAKGGGNMVFKILKGGAKDVPDAEETGGGKKTSAKISTADLDQKDKEPKLTGPGAKASRRAQGPNFDPSVTGRAKR